MLKITAVTEDSNGERAELTLSLPERFSGVLDTDGARDRIRLMLQRDVERALTVASVAELDALGPEMRVARNEKGGPDQVAFAGTKAKAVTIERKK